MTAPQRPDGLDLEGLFSELANEESYSTPLRMQNQWKAQRHDKLVKLIRSLDQHALTLEQQLTEAREEAKMTGHEGPLEWRVNRGSGQDAWLNGVGYNVRKSRVPNTDTPWVLGVGTDEAETFPTKRLAMIAGQKHARALLSQETE